MLLAVIAALDRDRVAQAIAARPLADIWPHAIELYRGSGSWRGSERNFRDLVAPFAGRLGSQQHDQLLDAVIENDQNWSAADTPSLLLRMLRDAAPAAPPTPDARNRFYERLSRNGSYKDVLAFFMTDGWSFQKLQKDDEG